jgi:hypothetical protein
MFFDLFIQNIILYFNLFKSIFELIIISFSRFIKYSILKLKPLITQLKINVFINNFICYFFLKLILHIF